MGTFIFCKKCSGPWQEDSIIAGGVVYRNRYQVCDPLYMVGKVCLDCYLASLIPKGYKRREKYDGRNATRIPRTGNDLLDCPSGMPIRDGLLMMRVLPH